MQVRGPQVHVRFTRLFTPDIYIFGKLPKSPKSWPPVKIERNVKDAFIFTV